MPYPGKFIVFEGPEGSGKSTQSMLLADTLKDSAGYDIIWTFEPGATPVGAEIRKLLLNPDPMLEMDPVTQAFLFSADRRAHCQQIIVPALEAGKVVISDRYFFSTLAYQCYAGNVPFETVEDMTARATEGLMPDLLIVLDGDPREFFCRKAGDFPDRFEGMDMGYHDALRAGFRDLAIKHSSFTLIIDGLLPKEVIQDQIWNEVTSRLGL